MIWFPIYNNNLVKNSLIVWYLNLSRLNKINIIAKLLLIDILSFLSISRRYSLYEQGASLVFDAELVQAVQEGREEWYTRRHWRIAKGQLWWTGDHRRRGLRGRRPIPRLLWHRGRIQTGPASSPAHLLLHGLPRRARPIHSHLEAVDPKASRTVPNHAASALTPLCQDLGLEIEEGGVGQGC